MNEERKTLAIIAPHTGSVGMGNKVSHIIH